MSREKYYYDTCNACGFPFASAQLKQAGAYAHFTTECKQCGNVTRTKVVHEHERDVSCVRPSADSEPTLDERAVWGIFKCRCGSTGEIRHDIFEGDRARLTSYCRACKAFSRWYWDFTSGTT